MEFSNIEEHKSDALLDFQNDIKIWIVMIEDIHIVLFSISHLITILVLDI